MKRKCLQVVLPVVLLVSFMLVGCAKAANEMSYAMSSPGMDMARDEMVYPEEEAYAGYDNETVTSSEDYDSGIAEDGERIVLKDANLTIKVENPTTAIEAIASMAEQRGGFVVNSNVFQSYYYNVERELPQGTITIRVPAEDLNTVLAEIKGLTEDPAYDVTSENVSGQDVTSQYTDLQSRLRNLEDAEEQMHIFMDDAKNTEDVLAVYKELKSISEEIEVIKGQLKYYEESAALSAIYVDVQPKYEVPTVDIGGWEPQGVVKKAIQALVDAFQFIVEAMIWIILFVLPVLLMISLPLVVLIFIIRAIVRSSKKKKMAAKKIVSSEQPESEQ